MKRVTIEIEDFVYEFYEKVGEQAGQIPVEQVLVDAVYKMLTDLTEGALTQTHSNLVN